MTTSHLDGISHANGNSSVNFNLISMSYLLPFDPNCYHCCGLFIVCFVKSLLDLGFWIGGFGQGESMEERPALLNIVTVREQIQFCAEMASET